MLKPSKKVGIKLLGIDLFGIGLLDINKRVRGELYEDIN